MWTPPHLHYLAFLSLSPTKSHLSALSLSPSSTPLPPSLPPLPRLPHRPPPPRRFLTGAPPLLPRRYFNLLLTMVLLCAASTLLIIVCPWTRGPRLARAAVLASILSSDSMLFPREATSGGASILTSSAVSFASHQCTQEQCHHVNNALSLGDSQDMHHVTDAATASTAASSHSAAPPIPSPRRSLPSRRSQGSRSPASARCKKLQFLKSLGSASILALPDGASTVGRMVDGAWSMAGRAEGSYKGGRPPLPAAEAVPAVPALVRLPMFASSASTSTNYYGMAQCTDDLTPAGCSQCLNTILSNIKNCRINLRGWRYLSASCCIRPR